MIGKGPVPRLGIRARRHEVIQGSDLRVFECDANPRTLAVSVLELRLLILGKAAGPIATEHAKTYATLQAHDRPHFPALHFQESLMRTKLKKPKSKRSRPVASKE